MADLPERLPPLTLEAMTPAQRAAAEAIAAGPRGAAYIMAGPFVPMLRSPGLTERLQKVGEFLRYGGAVPLALKELAILTTARHWDQDYEWFIHAPIGLQAGLTPALLTELAAGARPSGMTPAEAAVHGFCTELHRTRGVSDPTYAAALALLGEEGLVDLAGICGYYATLAMIMNTARTALPEGETPFAVPSAQR